MVLKYILICMLLPGASAKASAAGGGGGGTDF
jgi:hypothetical protein